MRRAAFHFVALASVSILLTVPGTTAADSGRFHDAAGDHTSGSADVDLVGATASHVRGRTDWVRHTATVRGELPSDREDWPWLVIDLGSQWRYFIDPRYHGGQLISVGPPGGHLAPVVRVDHNTVRYEFKTRWLDLGRPGEYCWSFTTFNNQGNGRDAMPDSVGLGEGAAGIQGGYRHVLRQSDVSCRD
jgi:hypothetical protein